MKTYTVAEAEGHLAEMAEEAWREGAVALIQDGRRWILQPWEESAYAKADYSDEEMAFENVCAQACPTSPVP